MPIKEIYSKKNWTEFDKKMSEKMRKSMKKVVRELTGAFETDSATPAALSDIADSISSLAECLQDTRDAVVAAFVSDSKRKRQAYARIKEQRLRDEEVHRLRVEHPEYLDERHSILHRAQDYLHGCLGDNHRGNWEAPSSIFGQEEGQERRLPPFELGRYIDMITPLGAEQVNCASMTLTDGVGAGTSFNVRDELRRVSLILALESTPLGEPPKRRRTKPTEREKVTMSPLLLDVDEDE